MRNPDQGRLRSAIIQVGEPYELVRQRLVLEAHCSRRVLLVLQADQVDVVVAGYGAQIGAGELIVELDDSPLVGLDAKVLERVEVFVAVRAADHVDGLVLGEPGDGRTAPLAVHGPDGRERVVERVVDFAQAEALAAIVAPNDVELVLVGDDAVAAAGRLHLGQALQVAAVVRYGRAEHDIASVAYSMMLQ